MLGEIRPPIEVVAEGWILKKIKQLRTLFGDYLCLFQVLDRYRLVFNNLFKFKRRLEMNIKFDLRKINE
jgi:hypothetical protein